MNDASSFPEEAWEELHFSKADEVPEGTDLSQTTIPAHPVEGVLACWAVNHPVHTLTDDFPPATMSVYDGRGGVQSTWYIQVPVKSTQKGYDKAVHKWKQVITALTHELEGQEVVNTVNPLVASDDLTMRWTGKTMMMKNFVDHLKKFKRFEHNIHPDFLEAGGMSKTAAQTAARKANFAKAREEAKELHRQRSIQRAEKVMALVAEGLTNEQLSEALDIAVASVQTTVARARRVLVLNEAELSKPAPVKEVSLKKDDEPQTLEELVALAGGEMR